MTRSPLSRYFSQQRPHIVTALRGTAAALTALAAAELLGLASPYWAAMTALIVIQPTRGLLLEKSFYRLIGTAVGSMAGLLLLLCTRSPLPLTAALCLWIALCVGVGNLLYGLRSYGAMMAGSTCAVIAMSGYLSPSHRYYDIAFGRVACIIVGIIFATLVTALFTPRQSRVELTERLDRVVAESLAWLASLLRPGQGERLGSREQDILIEIAEIESLLDAVGAGSSRFKRQSRQLRSLIASLLSLLAVGRLTGEQLARHAEAEGGQGEWRGLLARHLEELSDKGDGPESGRCRAALAALAAEAKPRLPWLAETLEELATSLHRLQLECETMSEVPQKQPANRFYRHRDWREAFRAAFRGALTIAAVGLTWSLTGWAQGPLTLMATSIMITIFSTKEHPAAFVGNIFIGAATGSAVAVFCRLVLLHGVSDPLQVGAIIAPFLLVGVFAMTQRRTAICATDATLFFIFTVQPGVPVAVVPRDLALASVAMVLGVAGAWVAYRFVIPINPALRLDALLSAIMRDLGLLASGDSPRAALTLQARMQHRVIRLVVLATRFDADYLALVEGGIAALAIAESIQRLKRALEAGELSAGECSQIREALLSLAAIRQQPGNAVQVLEGAGSRLYDLLGAAALGERISGPAVGAA